MSAAQAYAYPSPLGLSTEKRSIFPSPSFSKRGTSISPNPSFSKEGNSQPPSPLAQGELETDSQNSILQQMFIQYLYNPKQGGIV